MPFIVQELVSRVKPKIIHSEIVVWNEEHNYAGTIDFVAEIEKQTYIIEFKSGRSIGLPPSCREVSAYKTLFQSPTRAICRRLGFRILSSPFSNWATDAIERLEVY